METATYFPVDMEKQTFLLLNNAFYTNDRCCLHHGTILVDSDLVMMNAVLCTPSGKMAKRSIKSVQARVKNIKDVLPDITIKEMKLAIAEEYEKWVDSVFGICGILEMVNDMNMKE